MMLLTLLLAPIAFYLFNFRQRLPNYLICLIIFSLYHLYSVFHNDLVPPNSSLFSFLLSDGYVFACIAFFIIENMNIEEWFIFKMNRHILVAVVISLIVSLIQVKYVSFFISPQITSDEDSAVFLDEGRNYSIYSWVDINSLGVTFPILIAILISVYEKRQTLSLIVLSAIAVSFLTKTRYVMISVIIVLSQLLLSSKFNFKKKFSYIFIIILVIASLVGVARSLNVDMQKVVDERILEKGKDISESSAGARLTSYNVFIVKFPEHPWFGVGPHTRDDVLDLLGVGIPLIHIGYLSYLYYYGIIGCLFFFLSLFFLLRDAWLVGRRHKFWGSFYGLLAFCVANLTFVYFNLSEPGIIIAIIYLSFYKRNKEIK
jgi:hypothetical protein